MRDINAELNSQTLVRCPDCGMRMENHQVLIQRHFMEKHKIDESVIKRETNWRFQNVRRIKNPLSLKNIFGRA